MVMNRYECPKCGHEIATQSSKGKRNQSEARKVWESKHGPIPKGYELDHIDGDKTNNTIENLQLLHPLEHAEKHFKSGENAAAHMILAHYYSKGASKEARERGRKESLKLNLRLVKIDEDVLNEIVSIEKPKRNSQFVYKIGINAYNEKGVFLRTFYNSSDLNDFLGGNKASLASGLCCQVYEEGHKLEGKRKQHSVTNSKGETIQFRYASEVKPGKNIESYSVKQNSGGNRTPPRCFLLNNGFAVHGQRQLSHALKLFYEEITKYESGIKDDKWKQFATEITKSDFDKWKSLNINSYKEFVNNFKSKADIWKNRGILTSSILTQLLLNFS